MAVSYTHLDVYKRQGIGWRKIIENMYKNATVAQWYRTHGKHEIYAKGKAVTLGTYEHSLVINAEDAARVRAKDEDDVPQTAADENRARRRAQFISEEAKVRQIYEEMVLKKAQDPVVKIGSMTDIRQAVPGAPVTAPVTISNAKPNGNGNGNGHANGNCLLYTSRCV